MDKPFDRPFYDSIDASDDGVNLNTGEAMQYFHTHSVLDKIDLRPRGFAEFNPLNDGA